VSGAERLRRHRARAAAGRIVVAVEIDELEVVGALVEGGLLAAWTDDKAEIQAAIQKALRLLCQPISAVKRVTTRDFGKR
jgi:hypothetical protein